MMIDDPIVVEIRQTRERIAAEHGYDIHRLFAHWRELEKAHQDRVVTVTRSAEQAVDAHKTAQP
jgi:hypothetical protein